MSLIAVANPILAPSGLEEQDIVPQQENEPAETEIDRKATGSPAALLPSVSQTHTSLFQNAPTLLKSPRNILDRLTSRKPSQHDTRPTRDITPSYISSRPASHASQPRAQEQQIQVHDENAALELESNVDISVFESSRKDQSSPVHDSAESSLSAIVSRSGPSDANTTTDASPRRFQNPLSMYDLSSGRSKAQGSCFGLVVGMIVAIVWL